jgi:RNA polymerase sigma factor (sigma-70 family)
MATAAPEIPAVAPAQAFEQIYRRYVQDVYRYALALLRNPADAEDVTQTTFMNAYRAFLRGEKPLKPQNWLIKIAHNAARNRYALASRRVKEVPLDDHIDQLAIPDNDKPDVREVLEALGRLPLNQRAALVMRELEGRTYVEIADTLDVSVPAVETLIFRARRSLRLKASSIRSLAVVPLPSSLSQFFDAGGIAAGGGAVIGSGFLFKAAVAVVAGVVATGVGGDHQRKNGAAAALAVSPALGAASERALVPALARGLRAAGVSVARPATLRGPVVTPRPGARGAEAPEVIAAGSPSTSGPTSAPSAPSSPTTATTGQVTSVVGSTVPTVPATPSLPVTVPPLPAPPAVTVPDPPLPNLP